MFHYITTQQIGNILHTQIFRLISINSVTSTCLSSLGFSISSLRLASTFGKFSVPGMMKDLLCIAVLQKDLKWIIKNLCNLCIVKRLYKYHHQNKLILKESSIVFFPDAQGNFNAKVNDKVHVLMAMIATNISKVSRRWLKNDKFHSWYLMNCNPRTWHLHPLSWNWCISNKNYVGSTNLQVLHKSDKILQIWCWCSPYK